MLQERPLCRFCLDSNNGKRNPLIEPCECRGSLRFVHEQCLSRWIYLNPARNGQICMLCMEPYHEEYHHTLESIPDKMSLPIFLLRFPFLSFLLVNYVGVFHYSVQHKELDMYMHFSSYQIYSQVLYFFLFYWYWKVKDTRGYWQRWQTRETFVLVGFHSLCNYSFLQGEVFTVVPLVFLLGFYWPKHIGILESMNRQ